MDIVIAKLLGTAVLGSVVGGAIGVMTYLDMAPVNTPAPTKTVAPAPTKTVALGASGQFEAVKPEVALIPVATPDGPSPPDAMPSPPPTGADQGGGAFRIGDKLRIGFYERMELDEEKWGRQRSLRPAFQQRMELSGEYTVNDDGTVSVPLVGSFPVTKRSLPELEVALAGAAEALIGRKGFVTIAALERQPVYVLGPVKTPGAYKYAPGMTVLHAVALAGGLDRAPAEPWQRMEAVRETGKKHGAIERTTRLMARVAVLKSEYTVDQPQVPPRLVAMVGYEAAKSAVREQIERRQSVLWMRSIRKSTAETAVQNAKREVETLADGIAPIDENIKLRAGRVESIRVLKNSNILANSVLAQAQSELSDVQERRQTAVNTLGFTKYRLAVAEQELARLQMETRAELEQEISTAEQDIADTERDLGSTEGVLKVVQAGSVRRDTPANESSLSYEIVRQSSLGAIVISAMGTASLEPGDLVRVHPKLEIEVGGTTEAKLPEAKLP